MTARLVAAQLAADGTYPNASVVLGEGRAEAVGDGRAVTDMPVAPLNALRSELAPPSRPI